MAKVYLRDLSPNASWQDKEYAFKKMFSAFKKMVADAGILHKYKMREFYESPGEKRRRKSKEAANQRFKDKLRENFPRASSDERKDKKREVDNE